MKTFDCRHLFIMGNVIFKVLRDVNTNSATGKIEATNHLCYGPSMDGFHTSNATKCTLNMFVFSLFFEKWSLSWSVSRHMLVKTPSKVAIFLLPASHIREDCPLFQQPIISKPQQSENVPLDQKHLSDSQQLFQKQKPNVLKASFFQKYTFALEFFCS